MNCALFSAKLRNVAYKMKTKQSSTAYGQAGISERAVDGNKNTRFVTKSCSHTFTSANPWWWVDLGHQHEIHNIVITVRSDCVKCSK